MGEPKTTCSSCNVQILRTTANKHDGLCKPCYRKQQRQSDNASVPKHKKLLTLTVFLVVAAAIPVMTFFRLKHTNAHPLAGVCQAGEGSSKALKFSRDSQMHKVVVLNDQGAYHSFNNAIPSAWKPAKKRKIEEIDLVICIGKTDRELFRRCEFENINSSRNRFTINTYRQRTEIRLLRADNGSLIRERIVYGDSPDCPEEAAEGKSGEVRQIVGDKGLDSSDAVELLSVL